MRMARLRFRLTTVNRMAQILVHRAAELHRAQAQAVSLEATPARETTDLDLAAAPMTTDPAPVRTVAEVTEATT